MNRYFGIYGALALLFQPLTGCSDAAPQNESAAPANVAADEQAAPDKLVIAFGDSLYAGYKLSPRQGFAPQLQAALRANGMSVTVSNAGVSGDTSAAGRARLTYVLDNAPQEINLVLIGLGGNDMLRGIKPSETRANLSAMLDETKKRGIETVLTGMIAAPNMGADYANEFNAIYPELAAQYKLPLYPFFLDQVVTDRNLMLADGIHPNDKGVAKIVGGIEPIVTGVLAKKDSGN